MNKFKRPLVLLLVVMLIIGVCAGCQQSTPNPDDTDSLVDSEVAPTPDNDPDTGLGDDTQADTVGGPIEGVETAEEYNIESEDAFIQLGDKTVTLPCPFSDITDLGLTVVEEPETPELDAYSHGSLQVTNGEEGVNLVITLYNDTDAAKDYKDCHVYALMADIYEAEEGTTLKVGKLDWSDTAEKLISKFGNPTDTYEGYGSDLYTWADINKTKGMDVAFEQETGKMYSCSLVNFTWEIILPEEDEGLDTNEADADVNADTGEDTAAA